MIKTIPKLGYGKKYLHGFPEPIHSVIKNEQISQLLGRGRIFDGRSYPYSNQFPILDTNVVGKLHILRQIAILDVGVVKEAIELLDAILERDIDHAPTVFFTPLTECEVHAAVYLLINFPQLYQVEAIIQSVDKTSCIELVVVV